MANTEEECSIGFNEMGLDDRITEAIAKLKWENPTLIQEKAIPFFLSGKDILARARTGSGKTGAYLVPLIHKILEMKRYASKQVISAIILAPSKELCQQIIGQIMQLTSVCKKEISYIDLSLQVPPEAQSTLLTYQPDIMVGTPSKILQHLQRSSTSLVEFLKFLIIDEADLMFAYDHQNELTQVLKFIPSLRQCFVTSATMSDDLKALKNLVLNKPVILKLEEPPLPANDQLSQYFIEVPNFDKVILLYALIRMNLLRGKTIIFVNSVNKCYKLKMFLGSFGIRTCVLNSELPSNNRSHIVDEFNRNKFTILITSDEREDEGGDVGGGNTPKWRKRKRKKDRESGVARGIDFQLVSNVINLDFPRDAVSYIHRVGRTARGDKFGTALSLISPRERLIFRRVEKKLNTLMGRATRNEGGARENEGRGGAKSVFRDYKFNMAALDGFRYRANDAWKQCTTVAVRDMRKIELKSEILASQKLKAFFDDNPAELDLIRQDIRGKIIAKKPHLKNVPEYNIPSSLKRLANSSKKRKKMNSSRTKMRIDSKTKYLKKMHDPLRSLQFSGLKKDK